MPKNLFLTMPDELFAALERARKEQGFLTNQELINSCVRKVIMGSKKNKGGRPKTLKYEDAFSTPTRESRRIEREMR